MEKAKKLKIINIFLLISFLIQAISGMSLFFGRITKIVNEIHENNGIALIILVVMHLLLNWNWIKVNFLKLE
ncbi:MAG: DUF4405 domain-containing protein [Candidatus Omnitrophica bacterium]|nr:DUF4405 domain-containing protein [Candidatus Omnitrophota bacterium]